MDFEWHFPRNFHFCHFWCVIFCPNPRTSRHPAPGTCKRSFSAAPGPACTCRARPPPRAGSTLTRSAARRQDRCWCLFLNCQRGTPCSSLRMQHIYIYIYICIYIYIYICVKLNINRILALLAYQPRLVSDRSPLCIDSFCLPATTNSSIVLVLCINST